MDKKEVPALRFTTVQHHIRMALEMSMNDYCIVDSVYHLCNNPDSKFPGWCYSSKEYLGNFIGVSAVSVHAILNKMIKLNLIEKNPHTKHYRTTGKWYRLNIELEDKESKEIIETLKKLKTKKPLSNLSPALKLLKPEPLSNLSPNTKETLDNKNKDNNNNKNIDKAQPTAVPASEKKKLMNLSSVQKTAEVGKIARGLTKDEIVVFSAYKENVPVGFFKLNDKSVKENIPKAFKVFQEVFGDKATDKFVDAIKAYCNDDWVKNDMQEKKGKYVPSKFFGKTFIKNNLIPLVYNQNTNGRVREREVSETELRQVAKDNKKRREEWVARNNIK